jgi:hypothetical protein
VSENKCYCDHCGSEGVISHYAELPFDTASASKGESGSLCGLCVVKLTHPEREGRLAHSLESDQDFIVFFEACRAADQQLGRPLLPGFSLSASMSGMMTVAYMRSKDETSRRAGERILNSALRAVGVDSVMRRRMGDGVGRCEALDALAEHAQAIHDATNEERPGQAEEAWHTALGYALDLAAEEGWESITRDPRKPPL